MLVKRPYIERFTDRHGVVRYYYRRDRASKRVPLPGRPGAPEFEAAYAVASSAARPPTRAPAGAPGTFELLTKEYFASKDYRDLAPSSARAYRWVIEGIVRDHKLGHRIVAQMTRAHVEKMMGACTRGAANDLLKKMRILVRFAIGRGWFQHDPTVGIKKMREGEHHTWTEAQIVQYEAKWPVGTMQRLAFALLLYTGQRASDVARMRRASIRDGVLPVRQRKTREELEIPLHTELRAVLAQSPRDHVVMVTTSHGAAFTDKGFSQWMAANIEAAGLPTECVTHGLRKAAARRLAEAGCTPHEIMSITGHRTLKEVERYTREAGKKKLAMASIHKLQQKPNTDSQTSRADSQTDEKSE